MKPRRAVIKRKECDGWAPFLCRERATHKAFKGKEYLADLCSIHTACLIREFRGWTVIPNTRTPRRKPLAIRSVKSVADVATKKEQK